MKILDCTLRDGGYTNNWNFTKEQVRDNYNACLNSNIEYCEIGFRRSTPDSELGVWYHTPEELINDTIGDIVCSKTKIVLMAQMGTFTINDFVPKSDSHVSMVRVLVAYHCVNKNDSILDVKLFEETVELVNKLKELGYEVTVNIGRIDKLTDEHINKVCDIISKCEPMYLYIADTYGNLGIEKTKSILKTIKSFYNGQIGFHAHDNLLNATVKSIDASYCGADIIDGTIGGLGRGSGNAKTELLIAHTLMKGDNEYKLFPVLDYGDRWIQTYKQNHVLYFITGMYSMHVNYAIHLLEKYDLNLKQCYNTLMKVYADGKHNFFDENYLQDILYFDRNDNIANVEFEKFEQELVSKYLSPKSSGVLELGARYGTVSCIISKILDKPENHIAVDPDSSIISALETNKKIHNGKFEIYNGVVSNKNYSLKFIDPKFKFAEYGTYTLQSDNSDIDNISLENLSDNYKIKFDTIIADCEGFFYDFIIENEKELENIKLIIYEKDGTPWCDIAYKYIELDSILVKHGFKCIDSIPHPVYENNLTYHSVWLKQ